MNVSVTANGEAPSAVPIAPYLPEQPSTMTSFFQLPTHPPLFTPSAGSPLPIHSHAEAGSTALGSTNPAATPLLTTGHSSSATAVSPSQRPMTIFSPTSAQSSHEHDHHAQHVAMASIAGPPGQRQTNSGSSNTNATASLMGVPLMAVNAGSSGSGNVADLMTIHHNSNTVANTLSGVVPNAGLLPASAKQSSLQQLLAQQEHERRSLLAQREEVLDDGAPVADHTGPINKEGVVTGEHGSWCSANIFVANIPSFWTEEMLRDHYAPYGTIVSVKAVPSRRFGFVRFASVAEAQRAIIETDKKRPTPGLSLLLHVSMAVHDEGDGNIPNNRVFVRGLPEWATDQLLYDAVKGFGSPNKCSILVDATRKCKGTAFVEFDSVEEAAKLMDAADKIVLRGGPNGEVVGAAGTGYTAPNGEVIELKYSEPSESRMQRAARNKERVKKHMNDKVRVQSQLLQHQHQQQQIQLQQQLVEQAAAELHMQQQQRQHMLLLLQQQQQVQQQIATSQQQQRPPYFQQQPMQASPLHHPMGVPAPQGMMQAGGYQPPAQGVAPLPPSHPQHLQPPYMGSYPPLGPIQGSGHPPNGIHSGLPFSHPNQQQQTPNMSAGSSVLMNTPHQVPPYAGGGVGYGHQQPMQHQHTQATAAKSFAPPAYNNVNAAMASPDSMTIASGSTNTGTPQIHHNGPTNATATAQHFHPPGLAGGIPSASGSYGPPTHNAPSTAAFGSMPFSQPQQGYAPGSTAAVPPALSNFHHPQQHPMGGFPHHRVSNASASNVSTSLMSNASAFPPPAYSGGGGLGNTNTSSSGNNISVSSSSMHQQSRANSIFDTNVTAGGVSGGGLPYNMPQQQQHHHDPNAPLYMQKAGAGTMGPHPPPQQQQPFTHRLPDGSMGVLKMVQTPQGPMQVLVPMQ